MRKGLRVWCLVCCGIAMGCFRSSGSGGDAGRGDVASDAEAAPCGTVGAHEICGAACPGYVCPPERAHCSSTLHVCIDEGESPPGLNICVNRIRDGEGGRATYCPNGALCAATSSPLTDPDGYLVGDGCVDVTYCEQAITEGLEGRCYYSDLTPFVSGPPLDCPDDVHEISTFCGPGCRGCEWFNATPLAESACVGVNEDRGFGVCAFSADDTCRFGRPNADLMFYTPELGLGRAVCMLMLVDGVVPEFGHKVFLDACRTYRDRFPDSVDCVDGLWNTVD